jgi:hypothetical protein
VVQRQGEAGQALGDVHQARRAGSVRESRGRERGEDRAAARQAPPRRGERRRGEREEHRAGVTERHPGAVAPARVHGTLPVDAEREREKVRQQAPRGLAGGDGLGRPRGRERLPARAILGGARDRLEQREKLRPGQRQREKPGAERRGESARDRAAVPRASSHASHTAATAAPWKKDSGWPP